MAQHPSITRFEPWLKFKFDNWRFSIRKMKRIRFTVDSSATVKQSWFWRWSLVVLVFFGQRFSLQCFLVKTNISQRYQWMMLLLVSHKLKFVIKILISNVLISVQSSLFPEHPNPAMRARMGGPHPGTSLHHLKIIKIITLLQGV